MHDPSGDPPAIGSDDRSVLDRREAPRRPCRLPTLVGGDANAGDAATVKDVSAKGVGLVLDRPLKLGAVVVIQLQSASLRLSRPMPVRVLHARQQEDGRWLHGCVFLRQLREEDLEELLSDDGDA
jgi:hypothetical protein